MMSTNHKNHNVMKNRHQKPYPFPCFKILIDKGNFTEADLDVSMT
jgi:hypothetical protein